MTSKLIASSTDTIPDPNRLIRVPAWQVYYLIHDKQAYEECKILTNKQKDQIKLGDSLISVGEGKIINLKNQINKYDSILIEKDIQFETFKKKKKGQVRKLLKLVIGEAGVIVLETVIIILIII